MVSASASGKKKKKVKKSAKRKPVNLQSNFARKCISASAGMTSPSKHASISADMFPTNHNDDSGQHHHHNRNDAHDDTGDCSCGDFHLHRYAHIMDILSAEF
jgi:hypothetical protein